VLHPAERCNRSGATARDEPTRNELALDVNVICLLVSGLFFLSLVTALAGPVVAGVYGLTKGRAEMHRA